jgi:hypothetical protein
VLRDAGEPRPPATSCTGHVYALLPRRAVPSGTSSLRPLASQRCKQLNAVWFTVLAFLVGSERAAALCVHVPAIAALDAFLNERTPRVGHGVSKRPGFETLRLARKGHDHVPCAALSVWTLPSRTPVRKDGDTHPVRSSPH